MKKINLFFLILIGASPLCAQHEKPTIDIRPEPVYISPNGDGIQDNMFFYPVFSNTADIQSWRLTIVNKKGKTVQKIDGYQLPALIKWDGKTRKGGVVDRGSYRAMLSVWARGLRLVSSPREVFADTTAPIVGLSVSTPVLDQSILADQVVHFYPTVEDDSPVDRWQLQILDQTGRTVQVHWGTGTVRDIPWDGKGAQTGVLVPLGSYRAVFQVWDMAGNESLPAQVDLSVNVSAREMLMNVLKIITIHETELGLIVQLSRAKTFKFENGKPVVSIMGEQMLREVAILANAYSTAPVRIDGYSRTSSKASNDQGAGSVYAWSAYSYLVKKGNVKASRIQVHGRGRSAPFNRRGAGVPVLTDGVEIILEGNGDW